MPQFQYTDKLLSIGQVAEDGTSDADSYANELLAQVTEVAIGGTTDGTYTVQFEGEEGTFQFSFVASGNTADQIADGLAAAAAADEDLLGIVDASSTSGTPLALQFIHAGFPYTITFPSNPAGNMTATNTQAAGGVDIPLGVGLMAAVTPEDAARLPVAGDTDDSLFVGVSVKTISNTSNSLAGTFADSSETQAGNTLRALVRGTCAVEVEDAVTFKGPVFMRTTASANGTQLGAFRSDNDGGNAIAITNAEFRRATTGPGVTLLRLDRI